MNALGVEETPIAVQGEKNIVIELPGIDDPQKAKDVIGKVAKLEFVPVEQEGTTKEDILYRLEGEVVPPDKQIVYSSRDHLYYLVPRYAELTGRFLKSAGHRLDHSKGQFVIDFAFDTEGGRRFGELTKKCIGKKLAIVLDKDILMAPNVKNEIRGGGFIEGGFSPAQAKEYAILLKSGAYSAPVKFEGDRQVGPSLGSESIHKGLMSCVIGLVLLFLFGLFYYRWVGLLSIIVLLYNLLLIMVGMYLIGATLTLPGIAGLVLTVGMAIDSTILIYERIREELKAGVTVRKAVHDGFSGALRVILDANITTLLTGIILYAFGTGPIQGFAATLMLGIASSLITGLLLLRTLLNVSIDLFNVQRLSI